MLHPVNIYILICMDICMTDILVFDMLSTHHHLLFHRNLVAELWLGAFGLVRHL
jgi:hypothetical protein